MIYMRNFKEMLRRKCVTVKKKETHNSKKERKFCTFMVFLRRKTPQTQ